MGQRSQDLSIEGNKMSLAYYTYDGMTDKEPQVKHETTTTNQRRTQSSYW